MNTQIKLKDITTSEQLRERIGKDGLGLPKLSLGIYWKRFKGLMTTNRTSEAQIETRVEFCCFDGTKSVRRFV